MKRLFLSALIALFGLGIASAQDQEKLMNIQETTEGIGIYPCGDRHEAMVQFVTSDLPPLVFESTHDVELNLTIDSVAGKTTYSIVFITQAPGVDYSGRRLTIKAPGFQDYRMSLPLQDKQKFEYTISDPYSRLRSPFFIYLEKAQEAFKNNEYRTAKDNYELSRYCPEFIADSTNILEHIIICDSMMQWSEDALQAEHFHKYSQASEIYRKMLRYNSSDMLRQQLFSAQLNFTEDCEALLRLGQTYLEQGEYERSQDMYNQVIDNDCTSYTQEATTQLSIVRKALLRRNDHARTLMAAWSPDMFGLSWGNYYRSRSHGWYGTIMISPDLIKFASMKSFVKGTLNTEGLDKLNLNSDDLSNKFTHENLISDSKNHGKKYPKDNKFDYEASVAVGCSWHIYEPLFIHFGIGYHGGGFDEFDSDKFKKAINDKGHAEVSLNDPSTWTTKFKNDYSKVNWFNGAAPEIGIVLKYWRAAVKVTYQYTYWINENDMEDFCKNNTGKIQLGIGFCW